MAAEPLPLESMLILSALAFFAAFLVCLLCIRTQGLHLPFTGDEPGIGPQKHHGDSVPRIGGVGILLGTVCALIAAEISSTADVQPYWFVLIAMLPAFLGGLTEDITKKVGPLPRLILTMASATIAYFALGAAVTRVDIGMIDSAFSWWGFSFVFTIVVVGGVAHSLNIIDGFNGLASGVAVLALGGVSAIAANVGDYFVASITITAAAATLGFLILNYPLGRIFLGDGGAYLLGTVLAISCVLLVSRNAEVSAWAPALILMHPVVETLYSIYRRVIVQRRSPAAPDQLHLHSLLHRRIAAWAIPREANGLSTSPRRTARNAATTVPFWLGGLFTSLGAFLFHGNTTVLIVLCVFSIAAYLWLYRRIVQFRVQWSPRKHLSARISNQPSAAVGD